MQSAPVELETDEQPLAADAPVNDHLIEDELLIEEISIDGMCGVY